ncbi:hypothetical protein Ddye_003100 [Dipteronia dyeriana]|uniref:Transmembrane protein n=1 Tax=Dipteronia dyeriana TaxID=168575 RepID=A0AAE0CV21_9ROSI|nr:hypothetical protein Ddye_003100 [Dipteronia dyeriana]
MRLAFDRSPIPVDRLFFLFLLLISIISIFSIFSIFFLLTKVWVLFGCGFGCEMVFQDFGGLGGSPVRYRRSISFQTMRSMEHRSPHAADHLFFLFLLLFSIFYLLTGLGVIWLRFGLWDGVFGF